MTIHDFLQLDYVKEEFTDESKKFFFYESKPIPAINFLKDVDTGNLEEFW